MKIAIIGTGITGCGAAYLLHQKHEVTLYERHDRAGGHARSFTLSGNQKIDLAVTHFHAQRSPNFTALLSALQIPTREINLTYGLNSKKADTRFQKEIKRLETQADKYLNSKQPNMPLGKFLAKSRYSKSFIVSYLLPVAAMHWGIGPGEIRKFPARSFMRLVKTHDLLLPAARKGIWASIEGGIHSYVPKLISPFADKLLAATPAVSVYRRANGVEVADSRGNLGMYDHVIFTCHLDQVLRLLQDGTDAEKDILSRIPYVTNKVSLHRDESFMPGGKANWGGLNYLGVASEGRVMMSTWLNALNPDLDRRQNLFLTFNAAKTPQDTLFETSFSSPLFTGEALKCWRQLRTLQGYKGTWYAGAWCGNGFHEDGLTAGLRVAEAIDPTCQRPWQVRESSPAGTYAAPEHKDG